MKHIFLIICIFISEPLYAISSEFGVSYSRRRTTFDSNNYFESESSTGSVSIYFMERMALELSYTAALAVRQEKASSTDARRTTVQKSDILGSDLILILADKTALFQPYIKGGAAQITRKQEVKVEGFDTNTLNPEVAIVPSYGVGLKILLTQTWSVKLSYDVWRTPIGGGLSTDDSSIRAGLSWML